MDTQKKFGGGKMVRYCKWRRDMMVGRMVLAKCMNTGKVIDPVFDCEICKATMNNEA